MRLHGANIFVCLLLACISKSLSFSTVLRTVGRTNRVTSSTPFRLSMTTSEEESDGNIAPERTRKRRRRKDEISSSTEETEAKITVEMPEIELKPRQEAAVGLPVQDIREITGLGEIEPEVPPENPLMSFLSSASENKKDPSRAPSGLGTDGSNDSLAQLLADAKEMQADEEEDTKGDDKMDVVRNVVSNIITADFFFVCFLLVWFLAGIFCSTVLKDDTVQIAFNSNFQAVAQPALGVLMIGSAAGALIKEDEEP